MRIFQPLHALNVLLFLLLAVSLGCDQTTPDDTVEDTVEPVAVVATVNARCPIMGGKVTEDGGTVQWDGKTIGFCCDGCDEKWLALSEEEKAEKLRVAQSGDDSSEESQDDQGQS